MWAGELLRQSTTRAQAYLLTIPSRLTPIWLSVHNVLNFHYIRLTEPASLM
ncbi:hypothetical protein GCM10027167_13070 [Nocardia heshunensis]